MGKTNSNSSISEDVKHEQSPGEAEIGMNSVGYEEVDERRTLRYIDFRILPILASTYAFSLIDRTNLSTARVAGMGTALQLNVGARYSIVTCIYFVTYIILQFPTNAVVRRVGVRIWITFVVIAWGAATLGMGFVKSWSTLALCRALIGAFEAGFFPAIVFIIACWYRSSFFICVVDLLAKLRTHAGTKDTRFRKAFYLSSALIGGFSPILAYGLSLMNGTQGIAGWSWIFIIEGVITLGLGIACWFLIPEFPDRNTFLTKAQTAFVLRRIEEDRGDSVPDEITLRKVTHHAKDWTIWVYGIMFGCATLPAYMIAFFLPIILAGMKFSTAQSLLLASPPFIAAFVTAMTFAWLSDRSKQRAPFIIVQGIITLVGCCMTAFSHSHGVRYAGTFLICCGAQGNVPSVLAWGANNVLSHSKRSVQSAITVAGGGIGGVMASTVFREQDSPDYIP
ncbi:hypothetical protein V5O48_015272, partial [Marasmius crinis-equi]